MIISLSSMSGDVIMVMIIVGVMVIVGFKYGIMFV